MAHLILVAVLFLMLTACSVVQSENSGGNSEGQTVPDDTAESTAEESSIPESDTQEPEMTDTGQEGTEIKLTFEDIDVTALMDDSETTQAFLDRLPFTISMNRYAGREYYAARLILTYRKCLEFTGNVNAAMCRNYIV